MFLSFIIYWLFTMDITLSLVFQTLYSLEPSSTYYLFSPIAHSSCHSHSCPSPSFSSAPFNISKWVEMQISPRCVRGTPNVVKLALGHQLLLADFVCLFVCVFVCVFFCVFVCVCVCLINVSKCVEMKGAESQRGETASQPPVAACQLPVSGGSCTF